MDKNPKSDIADNQNDTKKERHFGESGDSKVSEKSAIDNLLQWEQRQYKYNTVIFCGTAGQGKRTTISTICQSAKIEVSFGQTF